MEDRTAQQQSLIDLALSQAQLLRTQATLIQDAIDKPADAATLLPSIKQAVEMIAGELEACKA